MASSDGRWYHPGRSWRIPPPAPAPHSSRGPGHRPLKAEITGSNPVCGTKFADFGPIHARIGPLRRSTRALSTLISTLIPIGRPLVIGRCGLVDPQRRHRVPRRRRLGAVERRAAEDRVEPGHRLGLHRGQRVAVAIERDRDLLVTQHLRHDLGVRAGHQLQRGEGVAQVVEADRGQPGPAQQRLELQGRDVPAPQRLPGRVREDQVVSGQPATGRPHHLRLSLAVRAQDVEGRVGQLD